MHYKFMRTGLFVPATRQDRIPKAFASGANFIILDLEDSIAPENKVQARQAVFEYANTNPQQRFWVRLNDGGTKWFEGDLELCRSLANVQGFLLPKAQKPEHIYVLSGAGKPLVPIIESALGLQALDSIAKARGVVALSFGMLDIMAQYGTRPNSPAAELLLNSIRLRLLEVSKSNGLAAPFDSVQAEFTDLEAFEKTVSFGCDLGMGGVLCIHPRQVQVAKQIYQPDEQLLQWAHKVVAHADKTGEYTFKIDGAMVDLPVIQQARHILELA